MSTTIKHLAEGTSISGVMIPDSKLALARPVFYVSPVSTKG